MDTHIGPSALGEDDMEMEFQVAPMVDVLLVLLLFFMATATTEVTMQRADVTLPKAGAGLEVQGRDSTLDVAILQGTNLIEVVGQPAFQNAEDLTPIVRAGNERYLQSGRASADKPYRVAIRADVNTPYERIHEVMKAAAAAGVPDVAFAVSEDKGRPSNPEQQN